MLIIYYETTLNIKQGNLNIFLCKHILNKSFEIIYDEM